MTDLFPSCECIHVDLPPPYLEEDVGVHSTTNSRIEFKAEQGRHEATAKIQTEEKVVLSDRNKSSLYRCLICSFVILIALVALCLIIVFGLGSRHFSTPSQVFEDCQEVARLQNHSKSGVYLIRQGGNSFQPLSVLCDMESRGGGWTVIQRRGQFGNPESFFDRGWNEYEKGFGDLDHEFWLGLEAISYLTSKSSTELLIQLTEVESGRTVETYYKDFQVRSGPLYTLHLSQGIGEAGDPLSKYSGSAFSTPDRDNDSSSSVNFFFCHLSYVDGH